MPIYEYRCSKCGDFEVMQRITDKALSRCPTCKTKVSKLMSNTSFQLKGTGWYVTDYARSGDKGKSEASSGTSTESGSEAKSESKSEAKSEAKSEPSAEAKTEAKPDPKAASSGRKAKGKQAAAA